MEFYIDENLPPAVARLLREQHGIGAADWKSERMAGKSDAEQLAFAATRGLCLVTQDQLDFFPITERRRAAGAAHAGVVVVRRKVRRSDASLLAALIVEFAHQHPNGLEPYAIRDLPWPRMDE